MVFLTLDRVVEIHRRLIEQTGGASGVRDFGALESALAQPEMTFGGEELYPTLIAKASALLYYFVMNHPFADCNKRVGHAAMETFLVLNGHELGATIDDPGICRRRAQRQCDFLAGM